MQVIRKNLGTNKETVVAGYDEISLQIAVSFLEHWADEEAKESKLQIRNADYQKDGKRYFQRFLTQDGQDVVLYYLNV